MSRARAASYWGLLVIISLQLTARDVLAMTVVAGGSIENQTWTAAGSPYVLTDNVTIAAGSMLKMEAGTIVEVAKKTDFTSTPPQHYGIALLVAGTLIVDGSIDNPVVIKPTDDNDTNWAGIYFLAGATGSIVQYAQVVRAATGLYFDYQSNLEKNTFRRIQILQAQTGIDILTTGLLTLDGVVIDGAVDSLYGIHAATYTSNLNLQNCIIAKQYNSGSGYFSIGIELHHTADLSSSLTNVTIDNFDAGIAPYGAGSHGPMGPVSLVNSIISNSQRPIDGTITTAENDDIWNSTPAWPITIPAYCTNCFSADPHYVGTADWHLQATSPCIDKGTNDGAPNHDADGTVRPLDGLGNGVPLWDVGAYEYAVAGDAGVGGLGLDLSGIDFPDLSIPIASDMAASDMAATVGASDLGAGDGSLSGTHSHGCHCSMGMRGGAPVGETATILLILLCLRIRSSKRRSGGRDPRTPRNT